MDDEKQTIVSVDDLLTDSVVSSTNSKFVPVEKPKDDKPEDMPLTLTPEQQEKATAIAQRISLKDPDAIMEYGANAQQQLSQFSEGMIGKVATRDTGAIGKELNSLMVKLKDTDPKKLNAQPNMLMRIFGKVNQNIQTMIGNYTSVSQQVDGIANRLNETRGLLRKDNETLAGLFDQNKQYFDALNILIAAGKMRQLELNDKIIPEARELANKSGNDMDLQTVSDLEEFENRLDRRIYDLETTRTISLQQAPQIRMIQQTNATLAEKIQSSITTAIPLWKNQIGIYLVLLNQQSAAKATRLVQDTTNDLLTKNSAMLKMSSIETAKANERAVVDVETLEKVQTDLIDTLHETLQIQNDGRKTREQARKNLAAMEQDLKKQLMNHSVEKQNIRRDVTNTQGRIEF